MRNRRLSLVIAVCLAACLVGATVLAWRTSARNAAVARLFGGERGLVTIAHPDRVEAWRLGPLPENVRLNDATLSHYPIISGPVEAADSISEHVATALRSPDTYLWDVAKGCWPRYGVALSFLRDANRIDVLLCFECDILLVIHNGRVTGRIPPPHHSAPRRSGSSAAGSISPRSSRPPMPVSQR